ncbi:hypothetical protein [Shimia abyssi]|nr:hypothetical protein [Shimia abyssi]
MQHTDFRHGQSQIVDLRDVVSYERDFTRIMEFQALRTEAFMGASAPIHLIYIAPNEATHAMAMTALRSWKDIDGIIALILGSIEEACDVLAIDATVLVASDADAA